QVEELIPRSLHNGIMRSCLISDPSLAMTVHEIGSKDHSDIVKLEALRSINAADLCSSTRIISPQAFRRDILGKPSGIRFRIPRSMKVMQCNISHQGSVRIRVGPLPAEAGCKSCTVSLVQSFLYLLLE